MGCYMGYDQTGPNPKTESATKVAVRCGGPFSWWYFPPPKLGKNQTQSGRPGPLVIYTGFCWKGKWLPKCPEHLGWVNDFYKCVYIYIVCPDTTYNEYIYIYSLIYMLFYALYMYKLYRHMLYIYISLSPWWLIDNTCWILLTLQDTLRAARKTAEQTATASAKATPTPARAQVAWNSVSVCGGFLFTKGWFSDSSI